jgi:hypothetical protein
MHSKALLGHRSPLTTAEHYIAQDEARAVEVARKIG